MVGVRPVQGLVVEQVSVRPLKHEALVSNTALQISYASLQQKTLYEDMFKLVCSERHVRAQQRWTRAWCRGEGEGGAAAAAAAARSQRRGAAAYAASALTLSARSLIAAFFSA